MDLILSTAKVLLAVVAILIVVGSIALFIIVILAAVNASPITLLQIVAAIFTVTGGLWFFFLRLWRWLIANRQNK